LNINIEEAEPSKKKETNLIR